MVASDVGFTSKSWPVFDRTISSERRRGLRTTPSPYSTAPLSGILTASSGGLPPLPRFGLYRTGSLEPVK
ncbi:hypothetical protein [Nonomuraea sp. NPDC049309]|uniref:hypothetical protein n=1 Tax=Nonomuraea sp. NPDC049309 TaxID=3364350 RepID=UPI003716E3BF